MSDGGAARRAGPRSPEPARVFRRWSSAGAVSRAAPGQVRSGGIDPEPAAPSPSAGPADPAGRRLAAAAAAATGGQGGLAGTTFSAADLAGLRARAAGLSLDAHRPGRGGRPGIRTPRFRGRGMEYSESRIYLPGDDIRSIDWRVTARTGHPHTKLFHEERERPVLFVVDLGGRMRFGTRRAFKSVVAAEAASLLAWAAVVNGDRAGGLVFAGGRTVESRVAGGRRGALGLIRALVEIGHDERARDAGDGIGDALARARRVARPGTLVVVISDFSGPRDPAGPQLARLREHNDLLCVWIYDRLESTPPPPARYPVGDGRRTAILDARSGEVSRAITRRFEGIDTRITSACRRAGAGLVRIGCGDDVRAALRETPGGRVRQPEPRLALSG